MACPGTVMPGRVKRIGGFRPPIVTKSPDALHRDKLCVLPKRLSRVKKTMCALCPPRHASGYENGQALAPPCVEQGLVRLRVVLLRFELRLADPESDVLPLHHRTVRPALVVSLGFEPKQTEPKSVVLPLHHETIQINLLSNALSKSGAKVRCFFRSPKFSGENRAARVSVFLLPLIPL